MAGKLKIAQESRKDCLILKLQGELIFDEVSHFEAFVKQNFGKSRNIAIDMKGLLFLDSSGMGSLVKLLNLTKQKSGGFFIYNIQDEVMKIIEVADLLSFFKIVKESEILTMFDDSMDNLMRRL